MAGASLVAAFFVNLGIGVIKTIFGSLTNNSAMLSEALHSYADSFNQLLLAFGIRRSKKVPDVEHPFGYSKVQFFWAFIVAVLIFGVSGTLAFVEGIEIIMHPEEHAKHLDLDNIYWNLIVLGIAIGLEAFAFATAYKEAKEYQRKLKTPSVREAVKDMQDPVLLSLLVEDSLALIGLIVAFIGVSITWATGLAIVDGFTSLFIGIILGVGGFLLAVENKTFLIGKSVNIQTKQKIDKIVNEMKGIQEVVTMKTMLLGPKNFLVALDVIFTDEVEKSDVSDYIDKIEEAIIKEIPSLTKDRIFIEAQ